MGPKAYFEPFFKARSRQILAVWILAAIRPNSDLNFAVIFWVDFFRTVFPRRKARKNPPKNPPQNSARTWKNSLRISAEAFSWAIFAAFQLFVHFSGARNYSFGGTSAERSWLERFFSRHEISHEKCSDIFPQFLSHYSVLKIPQMDDAQNRRERTSTHERAHEWVHEWPHESAHESPHESTHEGWFPCFQPFKDSPRNIPRRCPRVDGRGSPVLFSPVLFFDQQNSRKTSCQISLPKIFKKSPTSFCRSAGRTTL